MTDNVEFVLRWEIDNASAVYAAGKAESKVFNEGGFRWTAMVKQEGDLAKFSLICGVDQKGPWMCEANIDLYLVPTSGIKYNNMQQTFNFDENKAFYSDPLLIGWGIFTSEIFTTNNTLSVEFNIRIVSCERGVPIADPGAKFATPEGRSNIILRIGDKKLHVSKEYLAVQSPVFDALFFGDYAEKGKEEVEIKDVNYKEFIDLLNVIYLVSEITDDTVLHILKLADRFQMKHVLDLSQKHLIKSNGHGVIQSLIMADQYRLAALRNHCLKSFNSIAEWMEKMKSSPDVDFSETTKAAIYDRFMKLKLQ